jgi:hypothetical protein
VHLIEVIENFPGEQTDPLFVSEFAPNERFLILGKLHLTLASLPQLENAIKKAGARKSRAETAVQGASRATIKAIAKDGQVVFEAPSPRSLTAIARKAKAALGLNLDFA